MIYINNYNHFEQIVNEEKLKNKKVLFTFGDSWTNNTYLQNFDLYPKKTWSYQLAEKLGYDAVINISSQGDSNVQIFENCLQTLCFNEDYEFYKCRVKELECTEIKCIIGWSSQIRDFSPMHKIFRPFNVSNIPYVSFSDDSPQSNSYFKFLDKIMKKEYYQYITQVQTILLQDYFNYHKIEFYTFMAFTPLVENEFKNTDWDFREYINTKTFYGLYSKIDSMAQKLNDLNKLGIKNEFIIDQPYYNNDNFINIFSKFFNKKKEYKELLQLQNKNTSNNKYCYEDGHPNDLGLEIIADELYKMITNAQIN